MTADARKWPNILLLCELIFSLPFSNGIVERIFSTLKIIKTEKRMNLSINTLRDLLEIKIKGPPFDKFIPKPAVELWWKDCKTIRRVNQFPRKEYSPREGSSPTAATEPSDSGSSEVTFCLKEWDAWFTDSELVVHESNDTDHESDDSKDSDSDTHIL